MNEIEAEHLIRLVKKRPSIWDRNNADYKSRTGLVDVWREICVELDNSYETLGENGKNEFANTVMKKWRNLRDTWHKARKKNKRKKYMYFNHLKFLQKNVDVIEPIPPVKSTKPIQEVPVSYIPPAKTHIRPTETNIRPAEMLNESNPESVKRKRSCDVDEFRNRVLHTLESQENRHTSFFKGILPSLQGFDEEDILEFQMGVLNTVQNIRRQKSNSLQHRHNNSFYSSPSTITNAVPINGNNSNSSSHVRTDSPDSDCTQMSEQALKVEEYEII